MGLVNEKPALVPSDAPAGLIPIRLKGAVLLLTRAEYAEAIRRGKHWRRRLALARRLEIPTPGPTGEQ